MTVLDHVRLMARYNAWMNEKAYEAAARLDPAALAADRGAFFGSILGTLNHLVVTDIIWLQRLAPLPAGRPALDAVRAMDPPRALDQILFSDLAPMRAVRADLDRAILAFAEALDEETLSATISYARSNGERQVKPVGPVLSHFFNHQTHHRGQLSTLLSQAGVDIGVTDLNALIPSLA